MATFLALCQQLASESGTVSGALPTTVVGQTGRMGKIVRWTNEAWRSIQNARGDWRWMIAEFSSTAVASGTRAYAGSDFSLTRHAEWVYSGQEDEDRFSMYLTSDGVAYEYPLRYRAYDDFYTSFMRGTQTNAKPSYFTITPDNKMSFHPIPDASYTVRGLYRKTPQDLALDATEPEMPARFHDLIVQVAKEALEAHDEAVQLIPLTRLRKFSMFSELERDQLPKIRMAGALA